MDGDRRRVSTYSSPHGSRDSRTAMTPLQKVAMGLVIVVLQPKVGGFDALPDVLGWVLVMLGLLDLRARLDNFAALRMLAVLAGVASAVIFWPTVNESVSESTGWLVSLPQLAFCALLCVSLSELSKPDDTAASRRFSFLRWVFITLAAGPVLVYGGGVDVLLVPLAVLIVAANVFLIYLLFKISKRPYARAEVDAPQ